MSRVRPWLPVGALDGGGLRGTVGGAVETWSRAWFAGAQIMARDYEPCAGAAPPAPAGWRTHGGAVALAMGAAETIRLAGLALGAEPDRLVLSEVDRDIIGRFTATIAADLARTLEAAFGLDPATSAEAATVADPFDGGGGLLFAAADGHHRPLLRAAIPLASLVPFRKAAMPAARKPGAALSRLTRAISATEVRVEARLGKAVLALGDLAALAAGDVLILDRLVEDGAELALAPAGRPFARGAVAPQGDSMSLILSSQPRE